MQIRKSDEVVLTLALFAALMLIAGWAGVL